MDNPQSHPAGPTSAGQLKWRCRRGMRELDVLLERYLKERYPSAPAAEQQAFVALLEAPDPQLFAYVVQREVPADPDWAHVIAKLRNLDSNIDPRRSSPPG
jgi:antitoxin CptB